MTKIEPGNVLAVPAGGMFFACKVIWVSAKFKDIMGMVVLPGVFPRREDVSIQDGAYRQFTVLGQSAKVIYCDKQNATKRNIWTVVGQAPVCDDDLNLLIHQVGASLYQGDVYLRNVASAEQGIYPKRLVAGNTAVEGFLKQMLPPMVPL